MRWLNQRFGLGLLVGVGFALLLGASQGPSRGRYEIYAGDKEQTYLLDTQEGFVWSRIGQTRSKIQWVLEPVQKAK